MRLPTITAPLRIIRSARPSLSIPLAPHAVAPATVVRTFHASPLAMSLPKISMPAGIQVAPGTKQDVRALLKEPQLFQQGAYIDGKWVTKAQDGTTFDVFNKASGALLGSLPNMGVAETEQAIAAAADAFKPWAARPATERSALLRRLYEALMANREDIAKLIVLENGKAWPDAFGEVAYGAGYIDFYSAEAMRLPGSTPTPAVPGVVNTVITRPVGVAALIKPWNFPLGMIARSIAPALAVGCTTVIKVPAETPYTALALAYLADKVGFPKGTINIVTVAKGGEKEVAVGKKLCTSPTIKKISFTGSTGVGKLLVQQGASTLKKLSMELGGNAPFIVFDDADIDLAVAGAIACKFRGSGQTCVCANRIFVHEKVYDEFSRKLVDAVSKFKVGSGLDDGVTHGPLVSEAGVEKVDRHVKESVAAGAKVLIGGERGEGLFYAPTILADVTDACPMTKEETFGPIAALYKFKTEEEVLERANAQDVGLAAYFFSNDARRCKRVGRALEVGMVGVNTGLISQVTVPFGGVKESGIGREGGAEGLLPWIETQLLVESM